MASRPKRTPVILLAPTSWLRLPCNGLRLVPCNGLRLVNCNGLSDAGSLQAAEVVEAGTRRLQED